MDNISNDCKWYLRFLEKLMTSAHQEQYSKVERKKERRYGHASLDGYNARMDGPYPHRYLARLDMRPWDEMDLNTKKEKKDDN